MSTPAFTFTTRARPILQIGIGNAYSEAGGSLWDQAHWDAPTSVWGGADPSWRDVTCDAFRVHCEYGRQRTTDRFVVGQATIVVLNATGWADPNVVDEPGELTMRPGRAVRVGVDHRDLGTRWLFRGFIDSMTPTYDPTQPDTVELSCIDALGEVNRGKLVPTQDPQYAGDTVDQRIARVLDAVSWPDSKRVLYPTADSLIAHDLGGQVADLLGQAADSGGGNVFGDLEANVVYRPRDWQVFAPGTPPDGTIGNVGTGHYIPQVDGYLTPTVGTVTTPDPGGVWPDDCTFVFTILGPQTPAGSHTVAAVFDVYGHWSWLLRRHTDGYLLWGAYPAGTEVGAGTTGIAFSAPTGAVEHIAASIHTGSTNQTQQSWSSPDGVTWTPGALHATAAMPRPFDSDGVVRIGNALGTGEVFNGRIYSVELRAGLDPASGPVLWRFDASDYPGTGTSYVDPRGRTWTLADATAITPKVPAQWVPADVCPVVWERPFARADLTTRVIIGRDQATAQVMDDPDGQLTYGIEPFERTDLLTERDDKITLLGQRILRVRAATTAPRVRSVTLDAATADEALDLMASVDVFRPSRYRCRLQLPRGLVFDAEHIATGVAHELTPDGWQLALNLDLAAPYAAAGGKWDQAYWDQATWATPV